MGKKEKKTVPALCYTVPGAVAGYAALQLINALLMSKEVVGEQGSLALVAVSAAIAVFIAVSIFGRHEKRRRLLLGLGTAGFLILVQILCTLAFGDLSLVLGVWPSLWIGALLGGAAGAVVGGSGKSRKRVPARRR